MRETVGGMTKPVQLNLKFSERAAECLAAEGVHSHGGLALEWPCTPVKGDLLRFDWMLGGDVLWVVAREFTAHSDLSVEVTLHLDLAEAHP